LNVFFSAEGIGDKAKFTYEDEVQKWLDLIRGAFQPTSVDNLKLGAQKPPMPFSDARLLGVLSHSFWFLPTVAACHAMHHLLAKKQNRFYHDYNIVVAAGNAGQSESASASLLPEPSDVAFQFFDCGERVEGLRPRHHALSQHSVTDVAEFPFPALSATRR
jgi:hypothetical protein